MLDNVLSFEPMVRFACKTTNQKDYDDFLYAYDYRIFYVIDGKVRAVFADGIVELNIGDILLIPPKIGYKLIFFGKLADYYILNFDIDKGKKGIVATPPVTLKQFNKDKVISYVPSGFSTPKLYKNHLALGEILHNINVEYNLNCIGGEEISSALLKVILVKILQNKYIETDKSLPEVLAKNYIDQNYINDIDNHFVAKKLGYHPYYLGGLFKNKYGVTLHDYIINCRLNRAKELLLQTTKSINEIAYEVGFASPSYFSEIFKTKCGEKPTDYRKKVR